MISWKQMHSRNASRKYYRSLSTKRTRRILKESKKLKQNEVNMNNRKNNSANALVMTICLAILALILLYAWFDDSLSGKQVNVPVSDKKAAEVAK